MRNYFKKSKTFLKGFLIGVFILGLILAPNFNLVLAETSINDINQEIEARKNKADDLKQQASIYQKKIREKQAEVVSLRNQMGILENKVAKLKLDIEAAKEEINKTKLEIQRIELELIEQEENVKLKQKEISEYLKLINRQDKTNNLEILLLNNSLSDFFSQVEYTKNIQKGLQNSLLKIKIYKQELETKKESLDNKEVELDKLKQELENEQTTLSEQQDFKDHLIVVTKNSEDKFYNLYWQVKQEQQAISNEIYELEKKARKKLEELKSDKPKLTNSNFIWPVSTNRGITTFFHDPEYPFRYLFEHPGVDVRVAQGVPIKAPADGYVLKARDAGMGYSYISLIHANGLSTVFGHVSAIYVKTDEFVPQGEIIGLVGGMPGTPGAGQLTTGAHLHFEVRLNGIPVNPLNYLSY